MEPNLYTGAGWIFPISKTPELRETIKEMNNITEEMIKESNKRRSGSKSRVRKSISTVMKKLKKLHEKQMKIENIPIPQRKSRKSATKKSRKSATKKSRKSATKKSRKSATKKSRKSATKKSRKSATKKSRKSATKKSRKSRTKSRKSRTKSRKSTKKSQKRTKSRKSGTKSRKSGTKSRKNSKKSRKSGTKKSRKSSTKKRKWETLEHNGVIFPESYEYIKLPLLYGKGKKKEIILNPEAEEAAMFYAKVLHLDHVENPVFRRNFLKDWKKLLPKSTEIKNIDDCDFRHFRDYRRASGREEKI